MSLFFMHSQSAIHEAVASIHGDSQFMTRRVNSFFTASFIRLTLSTVLAGRALLLLNRAQK